MGTAARGAAVPKVGHNTEAYACSESAMTFTPE